MNANRMALPIDAFIGEITQAAISQRALVLTAAPGAGKTTRVPPALLSALSLDRPELWLLEPRRLAARAAASRIAEEQGWTLGEEVGYQVRFESKIGSNTRLHCLTEGLLARRLARDPELKNVGCVVLDEFHERSWHVDLALGLLYELQQTYRPDLVIVVMSATLDSARISKFLGGAKVIDVPGRLHPVAIEMSARPQTPQTGPDFSRDFASLLRDLMSGAKARHGDILAFLPGAGEIGFVAGLIADPANKYGFDVRKLHGSLSLEEQRFALLRGDKPRVVLATNVAETSVTVDGVGTVVDSGLARVMRQDAEGFPSLELSRISRFSAIQRAGRAGRQGAGICYRLWTKLDERSMPESEVPEILRMDLSEAVLFLAAQGTRNPESFSWIDAPKPEHVRAASNKLQALEAIDANGALRPEGEALLRFPLSPRLAKLVLEGVRGDEAWLASGLAATLAENDLAARGGGALNHDASESDPIARLALLDETDAASSRGGRGHGDLDRGAIVRAQKAREQIFASAKEAARALRLPDPKKRRGEEINESAAKKLLLTCYSDLVARRRTSTEKELCREARLVGGKGAKLSLRSRCLTSEFFVCVRASEISRQNKSELSIEWASAIERDWLKENFPERIAKKTWAAWDAASEQALAYSALCYLDLPLEELKISRPDASAAEPLLIEAILQKWDSLLARDPAAERFVARLRFARSQAAPQLLPPAPQEDPWPEIDDAFKRSVATSLALGATKLDAVLKKSWADALQDALSWEQKKKLEEIAPAFFAAPSGSRIPIEYPEAQTPYVEVRIQEIFGMARSPALAQGKIGLQLRLLAPNFRPVQTTQDLASFWKTGYLETRKELRARYPKHSWPENPETAKPEAKGRRK